MQIKPEATISGSFKHLESLALAFPTYFSMASLRFSLSVEGFGVINDGFIIEMGWVILILGLAFT